VAVTLACAKGQESSSSLLVSTLDGPVRGRRVQGVDQRFGVDVEWNSFTGIPFAAPPTGDRRFAAPSPPEKWLTPLDATQPENRTCPSLSISIPGILNGSGILDPSSDEDCLYLRVYVPQSVNGTKVSGGLLPVLFWVHGGGFMSGSGNLYGPLYWMSHQVVVVTSNYRLGPLGFLSLGTSEVSGNMGLRDQNMAMLWVRDNIASFGGDPDQVTINGQSAGSFSLTYHMFSPKSSGLFHRVIAQSGAAPFAPAFHSYTAEDAARYGNTAAGILGCSDIEARLDCLRKLPVEAFCLMDVPMELMSQPAIDDFSEDPFLPVDPKVAIVEGSYNSQVDIILGMNKDEGLMIMEYFMPFPVIYALLRSAWDILGPFALFGIHHNDITEDDIAKSILVRDEYIGSIHDINAIHFDGMTRMFTDAFIWYGVDKFLDNHLKHSNRNSFQYMNIHMGQYHSFSCPGLNHTDIPGVSHSDELYYMWNPYFGQEYPLNQDDTMISAYFTTMWSNFIKYGDPTPPSSSHDLEVTWNPQTLEDRRYLVIDSQLKMDRSKEYQDRVSFWKTLDL